MEIDMMTIFRYYIPNGSQYIFLSYPRGLAFMMSLSNKGFCSGNITRWHSRNKAQPTNEDQQTTGLGCNGRSIHAGMICGPIPGFRSIGKQNTKKITSQWLFADPAPRATLPLLSPDYLR